MSYDAAATLIGVVLALVVPAVTMFGAFLVRTRHLVLFGLAVVATCPAIYWMAGAAMHSLESTIPPELRVSDVNDFNLRIGLGAFCGIAACLVIGLICMVAGGVALLRLALGRRSTPEAIAGSTALPPINKGWWSFASVAAVGALVIAALAIPRDAATLPHDSQYAAPPANTGTLTPATVPRAIPSVAPSPIPTEDTTPVSHWTRAEAEQAMDGVMAEAVSASGPLRELTKQEMADWDVAATSSATDLPCGSNGHVLSREPHLPRTR